MRKPRKSRVRVRACQALTTYTRLQICFSYVQDSTDWREWTFRMVSQRQLTVLLAGGDAKPVTRRVDGVVTVVGYRATRPIRQSDVSPSSLGPATMAVAAMGPGDAMGRGEQKELARFRLWPFTGDSRACLTGPKPTTIEIAFMRSFLATNPAAIRP